MTRARKALAGLATALALLAAAELLLRAVAGPPPPPVRVYGGLDQLDVLIAVEDGQVQPRFQALALGALGGRPGVGGTHQAAPLPFPVEAREPRVLVIGGSSVHGGNGTLPADHEFPQRLDALPGVEVRNLGAPALDSFELVRLVEQLDAVPHGLLVVYTGHNDYANTWFQGRYGDLTGGLVARTSALLGRLQLYSRLRRALRPPTGSAVPLGPSQRPALHAAQLQQAAVQLSRNLERIAWLSARRDVEVVLVTPVSDLLRAPLGDRCEGADCAVARWQAGVAAADPAQAATHLRRARDLDGVPLRAHDAAGHAVRAAAARTGATLVDAELLLPRDPRADVPAAHLFLDAVHLSTEGHAAMAALLAPAVQGWAAAR